MTLHAFARGLRLACAAGIGLCAAAAAQQVVHRGSPASPTVALRLWLPAGEVQVRYWARDSVDVTAGLTKGTQLVGGVSGGAGKYAIEHADQRIAGFASAKIVLTLPSRATLWVKSTTASVVVTGGAGSLDVLTVTGRTLIHDAAGSLTVESIEGDVDLRRTTGVARIRAGAGEVRLHDVRGHTTVVGVAGAIRVNPEAAGDAMIPEGRLETVGGAILVRGRVAPSSALRIETHNGAVDLRLHADALPQVLGDPARQSTIDAQLRRIGKALSDRRITVSTFKGKINIGQLGGIP